MTASGSTSANPVGDLGELSGFLATGRLHPVIAGRVPLEGVVEAHRRIERAEVEGRLVILPNG